jgi:hypothetical protein
MANVGRMSMRIPVVIAMTATLAAGTSCARSDPVATAVPGLESSTTPPSSAVECGVSELLVPDCGIWFGASTPSYDGQFDYERGLVEYEVVAANEPDILHFYQRGGEPFPTETQRRLADRPGRQRSLLLISWKPDPESTWREIADGEADAAIDSVADGIRSYPRRLFLTVHHEPENDVIDAPGSGMTTADYVDMYRHVVERLRASGVENVVYVMNYMGFERWAPYVDELYPGDDVVDWIAYDPYGFVRHESFAGVINDPGEDGWSGFYEWATAKAPGTPIMLAEWGLDPDVMGSAAEIIAEAPRVLQQDFPMVKATVYWNAEGPRVDARLRNRAVAAPDYATAYRRIAADPYFNSTSTETAP